jgi:hypothetical protein
VRLRIGEKDTPVVLESRGPEASESDVASFEARLGYKLPHDCREFILQYNGGDPVVGVVSGRDDDPDVPYQPVMPYGISSSRREPDHFNDQIRLTPDATADIL